MPEDRTVAIVDPFSTGADLAPQLAARGWRSVAVLSTAALPSIYHGKLRRSDFEAVIVHDSNLSETVEAVARFRPSAVVPGTEIGVEVADALAASLDLSGNDARLSRARRDKSAMARAVTAAGLRAPRTFRCARVDEAVRWASTLDSWPVVVKPVDSAGADGVTFCDGPEEVGEAFRLLHGALNRLGLVNEALVVQELLVGEQYFVNTVSRDGRHYVGEIWHDRRARVAGAGLVCDREDLLEPDGPKQNVIRGYVAAVLDALGIRWGPAHTELMLTADGPVLIEAAARMQGTIAHEAVIAATGHSHVTLTVESITDPDGFDARIRLQNYELKRCLSVVSLIAPWDGWINHGDAAGTLLSLPSLHVGLGNVLPGTPIRRTVDLFSSPGFCYLLAESAQQIEQDYAAIRDLERNGLYLAEQVG